MRKYDFKAKDLTKFYYTNGIRFQALSNVDITANRGDIIGIIGPSGGGKSTLLEVLALQSSYFSGSIRYLHRRLYPGPTPRRKYLLSLVPQDSGKLLNPIRKVCDLILDIKFVKRIKGSELRNIVEVFGFFSKDMEKNVFMLSAGQKHRLTLLRSFLLNPKLFSLMNHLLVWIELIS